MNLLLLARSHKNRNGNQNFGTGFQVDLRSNKRHYTEKVNQKRQTLDAWPNLEKALLRKVSEEFYFTVKIT